MKLAFNKEKLTTAGDCFQSHSDQNSQPDSELHLIRCFGGRRDSHCE